MAEFVMRISDLSSDVCSSDLWQYDLQSNDTFCSNLKFDLLIFDLVRGVLGYDGIDGAVLETPEKRLAVFGCTMRRTHFIVTIEARSEEHTSDLKSLMRISYAVFCLTKRKMIPTTE